MGNVCNAEDAGARPAWARMPRGRLCRFGDASQALSPSWPAPFGLQLGSPEPALSQVFSLAGAPPGWLLTARYFPAPPQCSWSVPGHPGLLLVKGRAMLAVWTFPKRWIKNLLFVWTQCDIQKLKIKKKWWGEKKKARFSWVWQVCMVGKAWLSTGCPSAEPWQEVPTRASAFLPPWSVSLAFSALPACRWVGRETLATSVGGWRRAGGTAVKVLR